MEAEWVKQALGYGGSLCIDLSGESGESAHFLSLICEAAGVEFPKAAARINDSEQAVWRAIRATRATAHQSTSKYIYRAKAAHSLSLIYGHAVNLPLAALARV